MSNGINIPARSYSLWQSGCLCFFFAAASIVAPIWFDCNGSHIPWWVYVFVVPLVFLICASMGLTRFQGVVVDPINDKITYGGTTVAISDVEYCSYDWKTSWDSNGKSSTKYWVLITGSFGEVKLPAASKAKAQAMEAFISGVRRQM